jgi:hypothetical protein
MVQIEQLGEENGIFEMKRIPYPQQLLCEYIQLLLKKG